MNRTNRTDFSKSYKQISEAAFATLIENQGGDVGSHVAGLISMFEVKLVEGDASGFFHCVA